MIKTASENAWFKCILTRTEGEGEFLGLDLSDVYWILFLCSLSTICHHFVLEDFLFPMGAFDHCLITAPFYQRLQLVTTSRHSLTLLQEGLWAAAQGNMFIEHMRKYVCESCCIISMDKKVRWRWPLLLWFWKSFSHFNMPQVIQPLNVSYNCCTTSWLCFHCCWMF